MTSFPLLRPRRQIERMAGLVGMFGVTLFSASLVGLHVASTDVDWRHHYVSDFATGHLGWVFVWAALIHGLGNLMLSVGLGIALGRVRFRVSAAALFALAAVGILVAALFATDPPGSSRTFAGVIHTIVVGASFPSELVALFLFSAAFARQPRWRRRSASSFLLSATAGSALAALLVAVLLNRLPAVAERVALAGFLVWEFWAALQLTRLPEPSANAAANWYSHH